MKTNKNLLIIFTILLFVLAMPAQAQDAGDTGSNEPTGETDRPPVRPIKERLPQRPTERQDADDSREPKKTLEDRVDAKKDAAINIREKMRMMMQNDKDFKGIPEKLQEKIIDQKEKFSEKLAKFKDEKKKEIAEKIEEQIQKHNQRLVQHFLNSADKLTEILSRIENRANFAKEKGADISTVESAIKKAKTSIASLVEATNKQQSKIYDIKLQGESTAKTDFGKSRKELNADIQALKDLAQQARVDVRKAAVAIANIKESQREEEQKVEKTTPEETTEATEPENNGENVR